jgi:hypothetical protein
LLFAGFTARDAVVLYARCSVGSLGLTTTFVADTDRSVITTRGSLSLLAGRPQLSATAEEIDHARARSRSC